MKISKLMGNVEFRLNLAFKMSLLGLIGLPYFKAYGTEPDVLVKKYCDDVIEDTSLNGNVLAYKNKFNQTIVLKSGSFETIKYEEGDDIYIQLEDIIAYCSDGFLFRQNEYKIEVDPKNRPTSLMQTPIIGPSQLEARVIGPMEQYRMLCREKNQEWSDLVPQIRGSVLHLGFGAFAHTELQLQVLYNRITKVKNIRNLSRGEKDLISSLLPARKGSYDRGKSIYSLFIPCTKCNSTQWLSFDDKKDRFHFLLLDNEHSRGRGKLVSLNSDKQLSFCNLAKILSTTAWFCDEPNESDHHKSDEKHWRRTILEGMVTEEEVKHKCTPEDIVFYDISAAQLEKAKRPTKRSRH